MGAYKMSVKTLWSAGNRLRFALAPLAAVALIAAPTVITAQQATVTGRVTATGSGEPLADSR
jgi:hypothetical protein